MHRLPKVIFATMALLFLTVALPAGNAIAQTAKQYKAVGLDPSPQRFGLMETTRADLESMINSHAADGWEFVGVQNHSTLIPGTSRFFGFWAGTPYQHTVSIVVFRK
jgi:hypothetical protein